jgi:hypothetical protein
MEDIINVLNPINMVKLGKEATKNNEPKDKAREENNRDTGVFSNLVEKQNDRKLQINNKSEKDNKSPNNKSDEKLSITEPQEAVQLDQIVDATIDQLNSLGLNILNNPIIINTQVNPVPVVNQIGGNLNNINIDNFSLNKPFVTNEGQIVNLEMLPGKDSKLADSMNNINSEQNNANVPFAESYSALLLDKVINAEQERHPQILQPNIQSLKNITEVGDNKENNIPEKLQVLVKNASTQNNPKISAAELISESLLAASSNLENNIPVQVKIISDATHEKVNPVLSNISPVENTDVKSVEESNELNISQIAEEITNTTADTNKENFDLSENTNNDSNLSSNENQLSSDASTIGNQYNIKESFNVKSVEYTPIANEITDITPVEQVKINVERAIKDGDSKITVQLKPATLGQVDINLQINDQGTAHILISVEKAETLELLQKDVKNLEKTLAEVGIKTDTSTLNFSLRDERNHQQNGNKFYYTQFNNYDDHDDLYEPLAALNGYGKSFGNGKLDIRV